jgi:hypothetical protein
MIAPRTACERAGRPKVMDASRALADRRKTQQKRAAQPPAQPHAAAVVAAPLRALLQAAPATPAPATHVASWALSTSEATPARVPGALLRDVSDAALHAEIVRSMADSDDVVTLVAGTCRPGHKRILNGLPLRPAEVYRAWCAELSASATAWRPPVWARVFSALSNAQRGANADVASFGGGAKVKDFCVAFLAPYLAAHPEDGVYVHRPQRAAPQRTPAQNVPSVVAQPPAGDDALEAPGADDDVSCPPTPRVASCEEVEVEAESSTADALHKLLAEQVEAMRRQVDKALAAHAALDALAAAPCACASEVAAPSESENDENDEAWSTPSAAAMAAEEDDDDVVYMKTTAWVNGIEVIVLDC